MCGRTSLTVDPVMLATRFGVDVPSDTSPRYNIAPGEELLTVRNTDPETVTSLTWGLIPHWADDPEDGPAPINVRSEQITENRLFAEAFAERRCLVLADGFYEWGGARGRKQPYRIERVDGEPFAYAGVWEHWSDSAGTDDRLTCTILTTEANDTVGEIHDRMPVMLRPAEEATWLGDGDVEAVQSVTDTYPDEELRTYPVSSRVNDPSNDGPELAEEVAGQSGLDEFGAT